MKITYIYLLKDAEENIRYIGKSNNPSKRLIDHISEAKKNDKKSHKNNWINSLIDKGQKPIMEIIEEVPLEGWEFWECYYISTFKELGCELTNGDKGGRGGNFFTEEQRKKQSERMKGKKYNLGNKHTEESKEKNRLAHLGKSINKGRKANEETKKKLSESRKGRKAWNKGIPMNEETKKKLSEKNKGRTPWNKGIKSNSI